MDSSRTQITAEELTPWQVGRLRDRLMSYKAARRHGWERISTDILFEEDLPVDYVDSEDVRPLSESLRRWFNGSQVPSAHRLNAVRVFLISQGYLDATGLDEVNSSLQAPIAFVEFITGGNKSYQEGLSRFAAFSGIYSNVFEILNEIVHESLTLRFQNGYLLVTYKESFLKNIDSVNRLVNTPSVRRRAMTREDKFEGWAACGPFGEITIFLNEPAFAQKPKFILIWAEKQRGELTDPVEELMLMPYEGVKGVEEPEHFRKALTGDSDDVGDMDAPIYVRPKYQIFTRNEGRSV